MRFLLLLVFSICCSFCFSQEENEFRIDNYKNIINLLSVDEYPLDALEKLSKSDTYSFNKENKASSVEIYYFNGGRVKFKDDVVSRPTTYIEAINLYYFKEYKELKFSEETCHSKRFVVYGIRDKEMFKNMKDDVENEFNKKENLNVNVENVDDSEVYKKNNFVFLFNKTFYKGDMHYTVSVFRIR